MIGHVPLLHNTINGRQLNTPPSHQYRFLMRAPGSSIQCLDFGFGTITTEVLPIDDIFSITYRIFDLKQTQQFKTENTEPGFYLHIRRKGKAKASLSDVQLQIIEDSCGIYYFPAGEITSVIENTFGVSVIVRIDNLLPRYAGSPLVHELIKESQDKPENLSMLPPCLMDHWVVAAVNLLLNVGRADAKITDASFLLDKLIRSYLNAIDPSLTKDRYNAIQLNVMAEKNIPTPKLESGTELKEEFQGIVNYLLDHLKTNYSRKEIARKSDMSESEFSRLFEAGYGKPFSDAYHELRMTRIIDAVVRNQKTEDIASSTGYSSASNLRREFKKFYRYPMSLFQWPFFINKYKDT